MEATQDQPQLNKDDNPTMIQLQTIVIVNTTIVQGEHSTNGANSSVKASTSSDNSFASNYNLFTDNTKQKCKTFLSCKKFAYILAIVLIICVISGLFLCPIISYILRDTYSDEDTQMVCHNYVCYLYYIITITCYRWIWVKHVTYQWGMQLVQDLW